MSVARRLRIFGTVHLLLGVGRVISSEVLNGRGLDESTSYIRLWSSVYAVLFGGISFWCSLESSPNSAVKKGVFYILILAEFFVDTSVIIFNGVDMKTIFDTDTSYVERSPVALKIAVLMNMSCCIGNYSILLPTCMTFHKLPSRRRPTENSTVPVQGRQHQIRISEQGRQENDQQGTQIRELTSTTDDAPPPSYNEHINPAFEGPPPPQYESIKTAGQPPAYKDVLNTGQE